MVDLLDVLWNFILLPFPKLTNLIIKHQIVGPRLLRLKTDLIACLLFVILYDFWCLYISTLIRVIKSSERLIQLIGNPAGFEHYTCHRLIDHRLGCQCISYFARVSIAYLGQLPLHCTSSILECFCWVNCLLALVSWLFVYFSERTYGLLSMRFLWVDVSWTSTKLFWLRNWLLSFDFFKDFITSFDSCNFLSRGDSFVLRRIVFSRLYWVIP